MHSLSQRVNKSSKARQTHWRERHEIIVNDMQNVGMKRREEGLLEELDAK